MEGMEEKFVLRINPDLRKRVDAAAAARFQTTSEWVRQACVTAVEEQLGKPKEPKPTKAAKPPPVYGLCQWPRERCDSQAVSVRYDKAFCARHLAAIGAVPR